MYKDIIYVFMKVILCAKPQILEAVNFTASQCEVDDACTQAQAASHRANRATRFLLMRDASNVISPRSYRLFSCLHTNDSFSVSFSSLDYVATRAMQSVAQDALDRALDDPAVTQDHRERQRQDAEDAAVREKQNAADRLKKMTRKQIGAYGFTDMLGLGDEGNVVKIKTRRSAPRPMMLAPPTLTVSACRRRRHAREDKTKQEKKVKYEKELLTEDRDRKDKAEKRNVKRRCSRKSSTDLAPG
ncbi:hypothetical protein PHYSODRAFT_299259 [Phytophthora sojae]|uniref:Uncharacterized protein n=1 Tax=Phytophthora sojae (strain P6497) TaxID=1094619 RepID=G4Z4Q1_PHYSP|nr:hypothetical protein PHYSODRAFT_299259 [Phytophthora sojae]EGZ21588.1 hypothetical protein PHYSODRAFT_299259 [Phytophthora sojae]|eukprot:XP_009524305.1 hypothetical protein PHYSODRAFT_299259 [Phytophthora sojae]